MEMSPIKVIITSSAVFINKNLIIANFHTLLSDIFCTLYSMLYYYVNWILKLNSLISKIYNTNLNLSIVLYCDLRYK